jgi:hypothetical protein
MLILSSAYLPPVQYFVHLYRRGGCIIEQHEHYLKQTYRNRCVIDSPNGALALTIPVEKPADGKCLMKDIRISDHGNWRHLHWQALVASYYNSPFFEYYQDDFRPFFEKKWSFLVDFNEEITLKCCELIDMQPDIKFTDEYMTGESVKDMRNAISPKNDISADTDFIVTPYYQVFSHKHGFLPNLSIADLLFNMGPESLLVLEKCNRI